MRSIAEIDRDHEGMGDACMHHSHGCTYPACKCDRSRRVIPNVRGVAGPKLTPTQVKDCTRNPAWQVPLAECCPNCLSDGIVLRKSECEKHGDSMVFIKELP
jgi:hypothetical protein